MDKKIIVPDEMVILRMWEDIKFFEMSEFDSPDMPRSGLRMNIDFIKILDEIRKKCQFPFKVNSGYRTYSHNKTVGGKEESAHTNGLAADIECLESFKRYEIVRHSILFGIKRIGIAKTFVHLDYALSLPQLVMWLY